LDAKLDKMTTPFTVGADNSGAGLALSSKSSGGSMNALFLLMPDEVFLLVN